MSVQQVEKEVLSLNNKNIFQNSHIRATVIPENVGIFPEF